MPSPESREQAMARALRRCSAETVAAAMRFQQARDPSDLAVVVHGVLSRDLPEDRVHALEAATNDSRLIEDLGMDSFGLFEVAMTAEEVFGISIENEEMKRLATIGQLKEFVLAKVHESPDAPQP
jgi:3-hydroxyacyl-[acyl-carrier-protein] dehydratase